MRLESRLLAPALAAAVACGGGSTPTTPSGPQRTTATVLFDYRAATSPRTDLPPSAAACVQGVGRTHIHPSWREFARIEMNAVGPSSWQISFTDVPVGTRLSIRISDGNVCDENPTGAATRNAFANDVRLTDVVPTPGSGIEPGLAFTVASDGRVTP